MNIELIDNPSIEGWRQEINKIISRERNLTIQKLGNSGAYIRNHFYDTDSSLEEKSIQFFFHVFDELIDYSIESNKITSFNLLFISQVVNIFRNQDLKLNTSNTEYLSKLTFLISIPIDDSIEKKDIVEFEKPFYEYCRYLLYFFKINSENHLPDDSIIISKILSILKNTLGLFSDDITNLSYYLLFKLNQSDILVPNLNEVRADLVRLYVSERDFINNRLNNILVDFAIEEKDQFLIILNELNCTIDKFLPTKITYIEGLMNKNLELNVEQLEELMMIYKPDLQESVIFNNKLEEICH